MYWLTRLAQNKVIAGFVAAFVIGVLLLPALPVSTADTPINLGIVYGEKTGLGKQDVRDTVSSIIRVAMGLLGIVAVVIILIGGFKWMTAGGNEEKVGEAKKLMFAGIVGLAIIFAAYAIAKFVLMQLYEATKGEAYKEEGV